MAIQYQKSTRHHYVPQWYQRNFLTAGKGEFYVFDKNPLKSVLCPDGTQRLISKPREIRRSGTSELFQIDDLYSVNSKWLPSDVVEKLFFGPLDSNGKVSLEVFTFWPKTIPRPEYSLYPTNFGNPAEHMQSLAAYINAQMLRTPRGLNLIRNSFLRQAGRQPNNNYLMAVIRRSYTDLIAMIVESHWQIHETENTQDRFLLSDEPITLYNFRSYPNNPESSKFSVPSPFWRGTRILFPLSSNKLLTLSHKEHLDKPSAKKSKKPRRNARVSDFAITNFTEIENDEPLNSYEVAAVNFVIKARSRRYVASENRASLFPERIVGQLRWSELDKLLRPRFTSYLTSSEYFFEMKDGSSYGYNAFGEEIPSKAKEYRKMLDDIISKNQSQK